MVVFILEMRKLRSRKVNIIASPSSHCLTVWSQTSTQGDLTPLKVLFSFSPTFYNEMFQTLRKVEIIQLTYTFNIPML